MEQATFALYVLLALIGGILVILRPVTGLMLIIFMNQFDSLIEKSNTFTVGRMIGFFVALGWLLRYLMTRQSEIFNLKDLNRLPLFFIMSFTISTLLSPYPEMSLPYAITITFLILMFFFIQDFVITEKHLNILILTIALSGGAASIVGILQYMGFESAREVIGNITSLAGGARFAGFVDNPNGYGVLLMSGIPLLVFLSLNAKKGRNKLIYASLLTTSVISLYLAGSRTHFFGLIIFFFVFVSINFTSRRIRPRQFIFLLGMILLFVFLYSRMPEFVHERYAGTTFSGQDTSIDMRRDIFFKGVEIIKTNPVFGVGFDGIKRVEIRKYSYLIGRGGHDLISAFVSATGLVGGTIFVIFCYKTFKYLFAAQRLFKISGRDYLFNLTIIVVSAFIALLSTFTGNPLVFQRIFWIYPALAAVLYRRAVEQKSESPKSS